VGKEVNPNTRPDLYEAIISLTSEVARARTEIGITRAEIVSMREEIALLPEVTAGRAVELLFEQMRSLSQKDFLKMKFASVFAHPEV
jgi:hypothetical protein